MARRWPAGLVAGAATLLLLVAVGVVGPWLAPDPDRIRLESTFEAPSARHWLGTDAIGRDMAGRVLEGTRTSLGVGLLAAAIALGIGVPVGAAAGYLRGWPDAMLSRLMEALLCVPTLLLLLAVVAAAKSWLAQLSDVVAVALVLGVAGWVPVARYLRAEFFKLRASDMVEAARSVGAGHLRIVGRHILPSAMAPVVVTAAFAVGAAIGLEGALSYLGLGVQSGTPTWGGLLRESRESFERSWWLALFPGGAMFLAMLSCNLIGEGIRDLLDPRGGRPS